MLLKKYQKKLKSQKKLKKKLIKGKKINFNSISLLLEKSKKSLLRSQKIRNQ